MPWWWEIGAPAPVIAALAASFAVRHWLASRPSSARASTLNVSETPVS